MAELSDINKTLQEQNKLLKESIGGSATAQAKAAEDKAEGKSYDAELLSTIKGIHESLGHSFSGADKADKKSGGLLSGLLGGLGGGIGAIAKSVSKIGVGFAIGLGAIGAGIAAFLIALGGADLLVGFLGTGENLKLLIQNFFGAFSLETSLMMGGLIGLSILAAKLKVKATEMAFGMTGIGAGIAGFFAGILLADGLAKLGMMVGLDGGSIATLISNFTMAFEKSGRNGVLVLTAILGVGALLTLNPAKTIKGAVTGAITIAAGMTGLGAGVAGFFLGIMAADGLAKLGDMISLDGSSLATLLDNFLSAFTKHGATGVSVLATILGVGALLSLNPAQTVGGAIKGGIAIAAGMTGLGLGMAGFFLGILAADGLAKLGSMISLDGSSLATLIDNFVGAFAKHGASGIGVLVSLLAVGGIVGLAGAVPGVGPAAAVGAAMGLFAGMTALGLGIAGFATGLLAADGIAKLGSMISLDGKSLAKLLDNFITAFAGDKKRMLVLTGLLGVAALGAFNPAAGPGMAAALTGLGLGIAGFMGGFLLGDLIAKIGKGFGLDGKALGDLLESVGVGIGKFIGGLGSGTMAALKNLDVERLKDLGVGMSALGIGLAAFVGAQAVGGVTGAVGGIVDSITSFFGGEKSKGPIEKIIDVADSIDGTSIAKLKDLGEGMFHLGKGLAAFAGADGDAVSKNILAMEKIGNLESNQFDQAVALGNQAQEMRTMDFVEKSAMNVSGGTVSIMNDHSVINNDNRNSTISQTSVAAKIQPVAVKET